MAAKWRRIERGSVLDGILACSVAVILEIIVLGDPFPRAAFGTDNSKSDLVPYFVTWHVTGRGYYQSSFANLGGGQVFTATDIWDITGSAITRFRSRGGLMPVETHYLTVTARREADIWIHEWDTSGRDCFGHTSSSVADPGSYSGANTSIDPYNIPQLFTRTSKQRNGTTISFYQPLMPLVSMKFLSHDFYENSCGSSPSSEGSGNPLGGISPSSPDLFADRDDASSFSVDTRYTAIGGPVGKTEVHWTAHAYLMGKCAERAAPIPADDPVIQNEDVHIDADDTEVTPDGKTKLHIKVTCDQVPIEGAEVDLSIKPQKSSGHHDHDNQRPGGKLDGHELTDPNQKYTVKTDAKGSATAVFEPPGKTPASRNVGIAGLYDVKATPTSPRFKDRTDTVALTVKFNNLQSLVLDANAHYEVCGRSAQGCQPPKPGQKSVPGVSAGVGFRGTTAHLDGEWGTEGTLHAFANLGSALDTFQEQNNESLQKCGIAWPTRKLSLNDIALEDGGLFDANSTWAIPHQTHSRGQGGDVNRFTGDPLVIDCNGSKVNLDDLLMFSMIELGNDYGHWDTEMNGPLHRLHLHVQD